MLIRTYSISNVTQSNLSISQLQLSLWDKKVTANDCQGDFLNYITSGDWFVIYRPSYSDWVSIYRSLIQLKKGREDTITYDTEVKTRYT